MNLTSTKFGYTDENGVTNDHNTYNPKFDLPPAGGGGCGCTDSSSLIGGCACTDEVNSNVRYLGPPIQASLNVVGCTDHQAPAGYKYVNVNGKCVLYNNAGVPVATSTVPASTAPATVTTAATDAITNITNQIKAAYAANPNLFLIGGAIVAYWFATKKK